MPSVVSYLFSCILLDSTLPLVAWALLLENEKKKKKKALLRPIVRAALRQPLRTCCWFTFTPQLFFVFPDVRDH